MIFSYFRLPNDIHQRDEWIRIVREANGDNYNGGGFICSLHFHADQIKRKSQKQIMLLPGTIPSVFMVDILEISEENCNCFEMRIENNELKDKVSALVKKNEESESRCSNAFKTMKETLKIRTQEMDALKRKIRQLEACKTALEEKLENFQETMICCKRSDVSIIILYIPI